MPDHSKKDLAALAEAAPVRPLVDGARLARILSVSGSTLKRMIAQKRIPTIPVGGRLRFDAAEVIEHLKRTAPKPEGST